MLKHMQIKVIKLIICSLLIHLQIFAQTTANNKRDSLGRRQGVWTLIMNDKGRKYIWGIETYIDDRRNGKCIYNYDNGCVMCDSYMTNDTLNGERRVYRRDSTKYYIENYKMGRLHGLLKWFDFSGILSAEQEYKEGILNGIYRNYSKSGRIISEGMNANGLENGTRKIFSDDDSHELLREFDFVNGEKVKSRFFKNGILIKEESFTPKQLISKPTNID
jgi:antitoxin component YwqK of YwqJK toxin-antitoxin module